MRIWIDTEFNGFGGDLISMALVSESGSIFYESLGCDVPVEWVAKNVMPCIAKQPISLNEFWEKLGNYLNQWDELHIIADWPEDIAHFCRALITGPGTAIPYTGSLTFEIDDSLVAESAIPHNALADAVANKYAYLSDRDTNEDDPTDNEWDRLDTLSDEISHSFGIPYQTAQEIVDTVISESLQETICLKQSNGG